MNLEKDKSYSITYATKSGETKSIELTPEQDMNTPKLINYLKNQDNEFFKLLDDKTECLDKQNNLNQLEENKMNIKNESKTQFSGMEFEKLIPHTMRFKEYNVLENSFDLYWVTQQPFDMKDLLQFQKALINDTPFAKAYVTVRDFSAYDPNEVNTKDIFAIVTFDKIDATGYMKACEQLGWLDEDEKDPSTWVINNVVTAEPDSDSDEGTLTEAEDKDIEDTNITPADTDVEPDIDFEDVDTYTDEDVNSADTDTENQEEISNNIETATKEVSKEATDTDVLAVEVSNSSIDVLIADEQSAIDGYNAFLAQCKDTLLPALYNVLETEIKEIIADEEEHITKLNTIKSAFHLQATPLQNNSNNINNDNSDDLDDSNINSDEEEKDNE